MNRIAYSSVLCGDMNSLTFNRAIYNAFRMLDTHGVPLAVQIEHNQQRGFATSLPQFYIDARKAGWKHKKARAMIEDAMIDVGTEPARLRFSLDLIDQLNTADEAVRPMVAAGAAMAVRASAPEAQP